MTASTRLRVAYADTSADQLTFSLSTPLLPALAERAWRTQGTRLSLRLLGASHQVVVDDEQTTGSLCETVACLPDESADLPSTFTSNAFRFTADVEHPTDRALEALVADLTRRASEHLDAGRPALIGHFPGRPLAVTAVLADVGPDEVTWSTWHTYPQTGEVVVTTSSLLRDSIGASSR
ncbi:DUF2617 family protein [Gordonia soli]|uniref:DUF2617 domain-containing protein n=1 Tax=Gordonia soli NBRC 108243 TaxID=1223545 RepID=M0QNF5_9ACTN|nr:DUF2617 family protein [Gordonia soli]GAC70103.1 hypothetical protein GS4_32_00470 [Gordonia soli NBRC 108243]